MSNKKIKIGLISVYYANYGSFFQTVALYKYLKENGFDCEIVNATVRGWHIWKYEMAKLVDKFLSSKQRLFFENISRAYRVYKTLEEEIKQLPTSGAFESLNSKKISSKYDAICIGSDELWSYSNKQIKFIPAYYGIKYKTKMFSYATSCASLRSTNSRLNQRVKKGLTKFLALSSRDDKSCEYISNLTNRDVKKCLDPTLLNPYFVDEKMIKDCDYVLVYGEVYTEKQIKSIKQYAKENNFRTVSVCWKQNWTDEFIGGEKICSSAEFMKLFAEASFCAISSFHGIIFATLHKKKMVVFANNLRIEKTLDLLNTIGIKNVLYDENIAIKDMEEIDYFLVEENISRERMKSIQYLNSVKEELCK